MAEKILTGNGIGLQHLSYTDLNVLRNEVYNINPFITVMRGRPGLETVFEDIMPPVVTTGDIVLGNCGKLPDPSCLTRFEFSANINKVRRIDEVSGPCDWSHLGALTSRYLAKSATAWSLAEIKQVFDFVATKLQETTTVDGTEATVHEEIEKMIMETLKLYHATLGEYAPKRRDLIVVVSPDKNSQLRSLGFTCCSLTDANREGNENIYSVRGVYEADLNFMPKGVDIMVYDPRLVYEVTTCENDPTVTKFNAPNYAPDSTRLYASEKFGFQVFSYPNAALDAVEEIVLGVKLLVTV